MTVEYGAVVAALVFLVMIRRSEVSTGVPRPAIQAQP
jgi:hypothetical protein